MLSNKIKWDKFDTNLRKKTQKFDKSYYSYGQYI